MLKDLIIPKGDKPMVVVLQTIFWKVFNLRNYKYPILFGIK